MMLMISNNNLDLTFVVDNDTFDDETIRNIIPTNINVKN